MVFGLWENNLGVYIVLRFVFNSVGVDMIMLQQHLHDSFMPLPGSYDEWRFAISISNIWVDIILLQEHLHNSFMPFPGGYED